MFRKRVLSTASTVLVSVLCPCLFAEAAVTPRQMIYQLAHRADVSSLIEMKEAGYGTTLIASILNCGTTTVNRVLQRLRPDLLTINQRENNKIRARELRQQGYTLNEIGKELKISRQTVAKYLTNI
jgi:DNA invertase Pin-like site-specific DNA recombinase